MEFKTFVLPEDLLNETHRTNRAALSAESNTRDVTIETVLWTDQFTHVSFGNVGLKLIYQARESVRPGSIVRLTSPGPVSFSVNIFQPIDRVVALQEGEVLGDNLYFPSDEELEHQEAYSLG